jgi:hypothetical protein
MAAFNQIKQDNVSEPGQVGGGVGHLLFTKADDNSFLCSCCTYVYGDVHLMVEAEGGLAKYCMGPGLSSPAKYQIGRQTKNEISATLFPSMNSLNEIFCL